MVKYWEAETPIEARTSRNVLRYYLKAAKLQVAKPEWQDAEGKTCQGKAVTLDVLALSEAEPEERERAARILREILSALEDA